MARLSSRMGKSVDLEKLRSLNFGGKHKGDSRARFTRSEDGRVSSIEIDHADGSREAVVRPKPTRTQAQLNNDGTVTRVG